MMYRKLLLFIGLLLLGPLSCLGLKQSVFDSNSSVGFFMNFLLNKQAYVNVPGCGKNTKKEQVNNGITNHETLRLGSPQAQFTGWGLGTDSFSHLAGCTPTTLLVDDGTATQTYTFKYNPDRLVSSVTKVSGTNTYTNNMSYNERGFLENYSFTCDIDNSLTGEMILTYNGVFQLLSTKLNKDLFCILDNTYALTENQTNYTYDNINDSLNPSHEVKYYSLDTTVFTYNPTHLYERETDGLINRDTIKNEACYDYLDLNNCIELSTSTTTTTGIVFNTYTYDSTTRQIETNNQSFTMNLIGNYGIASTNKYEYSYDSQSRVTGISYAVTQIADLETITRECDHLRDTPVEYRACLERIQQNTFGKLISGRASFSYSGDKIIKGRLMEGTNTYTYTFQYD